MFLSIDNKEKKSLYYIKNSLLQWGKYVYNFAKFYSAIFFWFSKIRNELIIPKRNENI